MVYVWEDITDWDIGVQDDFYEYVVVLAEERLVLTEEELLEVFVSILSELVLYELLFEQLEVSG